MKIAFRPKRFRPEAQDTIQLCNEVIDDYREQGYRLTLRQLYYQLVTRNVITNTERSYQGLSKLVSDGRLAGLIDWDAIEDRGRQPYQAQDFENLEELVEAAVHSYRLPRWKDQGRRVELWVEKDALAGVLRPIANKFHVTLMVNKGYSSQSAMYAAALRFGGGQFGERDGLARMLHQSKLMGRKREADMLLYLGDHDPSGEDMVRDIRERLEMFGAVVGVFKIALTMAQVKQFKPPPNPAKVTDPRAKDYIEKHGDSSWEVDALPPEILTKLIEAAFETLIDKPKMNRVLKQEAADKKRLRKAVESLK